MTKPWLGGCSWPEGREQEEESRMKSYTGASQRDAERSTMRAVGQGHCHQAQVMLSQAFALGCARTVSPAEVTPQNGVWKRLEVLQELFGVLSLGFRVP